MTAQGIDHTTEAARVLRDVRPDLDATYGGAMAYAQAHATLALVEQQRIANLIALAQHSGPLDDAMRDLYDESAAALVRFEMTPATPSSGPDEFSVIRDEIKKGLGL